MFKFILILFWALSANLVQSEDHNVRSNIDCSNNLHRDCFETREISSKNDDNTKFRGLQGIDLGVTKEYDFDRLSDEDCSLFKSKPAEYWQADGQETTLRQVVLIHRHGDRTPIQFTEKDLVGREPFWDFHGLGQLTNRGKSRLSMLGQIARMRYDRFMRRSANKNLRKTRASGSLRCIESAQVFLSSFLGLNRTVSSDAELLQWGPEENRLSHLWQPASVRTLAAKFDGMLNEGAACNRLDEEYRLLDRSEENRNISEEYSEESRVLKDVLGFETDHFYKWFWASSVIEVERSYFSSEVDPRLIKVYDRIEEAGNRAIVLYQSTLQSKRLRAGLLINDIINNMLAARQNYPRGTEKKFIHYSTHDMNLVVLLGMMENIEKYPIRPDYAANIILELHQDQDEWFVRIFYMPHVPEKPIELHVSKCEADNPKNRCTLEEFNQLMAVYKVDCWQNWMRECNNDLNLVDPYDENL